ncbi:MAG TPA: hypothetical protein VGE47_07400, partial [Burkholderiaceae bacterium]
MTPKPEILLNLIERSADALALFGLDGAMSWANPAFHQQFAPAPSGAEWPALLRAWGVAERRRRLPQRSYAATLNDGRWVWISETRDANGALLVSVSDVSALRSAPAVAAAGSAAQPDRAGALAALQQA